MNDLPLIPTPGGKSGSQSDLQSTHSSQNLLQNDPDIRPSVLFAFLAENNSEVFQSLEIKAELNKPLGHIEDSKAQNTPQINTQNLSKTSFTIDVGPPPPVESHPTLTHSSSGSSSILSPMDPQHNKELPLEDDSKDDGMFTSLNASHI